MSGAPLTTLGPAAVAAAVTGRAVLLGTNRLVRPRAVPRITTMVTCLGQAGLVLALPE